MSEIESTTEEVLQRLREETGVSYDPNTGTLSFTAPKNDTEHFVDFIAFVIDEGFITASELPYNPGYGKIRYLLNTEPTHRDDRNMTRPVEVDDGIYLETNHDSESKKRYSKLLLEDFVIQQE